MWQALFLRIFLGCFIIFPTLERVQSVRGGQEAAPGQYSYSAALKRNEIYFCSGSVISKNHVVTAAHCIIPNVKSKPDKSPMQAVVGTNNYKNLGSSGIVADVVTIFIPKMYLKKDTGSSRIGDVAVLKIGQDLDLGIKNIGLSKLFLPEDMSYEGLPTDSTGFGNMLNNPSPPSTSTDQGEPGMLRALKTTVLPASDCQKLYGYIFDKKKQMCVLIEPTTLSDGFCPGDAGGPLVFNGDTLVGVLSAYVKDCGVNTRPYIYTRIFAFKDFIKRATKDRDDGDIYSISLPVRRLSVNSHGLYI